MIGGLGARVTSRDEIHDLTLRLSLNDNEFPVFDLNLNKASVLRGSLLHARLYSCRSSAISDPAMLSRIHSACLAVGYSSPMIEERRTGRWRGALIALLVTVGLSAIVLAMAVAIQPAWVGKDSQKDVNSTGARSKVPQVLSSPVASAAPTTARPVATPSAKASPDPALSAEITTAQRVVDKYWSRHWSESFPGKYVSPRIVGTYDGSSSSSPFCGSERLPPDNAMYCRPADFLAWDAGLMARGYKDGDAWPYLVIAHEWGHAIQARIGKTLTSTASELQADCLAGATLFGAVADGDLIFEAGDQKELASALSSLADETSWTNSADHGDPFERIGSFDQGRLHGLSACIPDLKPSHLGDVLVYGNGISVSVRTKGYRELTPVGTTATPGKAVIFEITVTNNGRSAFDAGHMSRPAVRYGAAGPLGELVPDPNAVLGPSSLPTIQPGETKSVLIGAVVPKNAGSSVRITVSGPNPDTDLSAIFEGDLP